MLHRLFNKGNKNRSVSQQDPAMRAQRLLTEYDRIFKCFRTHPYISVKEVFGTPPEKYHFLYRVDGLVHTGKSIESKNVHIIEIALPANYPAKEPVCRALTPIYHPNISSEIIDIKQLMTPGIFLADLVVRIGELIVYQRYSIDNPLNEEASQWAARNKSILPLSPVNLNYTLPQEASDTKPVVGKDQKPTEASEGAETADSAPAGNAQKTESITIESDSASINLDQETTPTSQKSPLDQQAMGMPPAEDEKKTEAIIIEPDIPGNDKTASPASEPAVQTPTGKAAVPGNQTSGDSTEDIGIKPEPLSYHYKKTEFISKHDFYCPFCGNQNSKKANFCIHCGKKLAMKSTLKSARIFFLASMIAVPIIIIGAGISAIFLHFTGSALPRAALFQASPSATQMPNVEPAAPNKDSAVVNAAGKEALQETETASPKVEKAVAADKPSSVKTSNVLNSNQSPKREAPETVKSRKSKVEAASPPPVRSKRTIEKSDAENAAPRAPMPKTGYDQQSIDKINNSLKLARLYLGIGSYDDAIAQYLDALMLDPTNQEAREGLVKARETKKATLGK